MAALLLTRLGIGLILCLLIFTHSATATGTPKGLFSFPSCVRGCVSSSEACPHSGARCICRDAKNGQFLKKTLECMANSCPTDLRDADDSFLDIMEDGCKALNRPIDKRILDRAEEHASSLYTNKILPPGLVTGGPKPTPTETTPAPVPAKPTTDTTDKPRGGGGKETTSTGAAKPTTTPGDDDDDDDDDNDSASETPSPSKKAPLPPPKQTDDQDRGSAPTTPAVAPPPVPAPTTPPTNDGPVDQGSNGGGGGFVDDSPFGNPNGRSGADQMVMVGFIGWAVLPLAAMVLFL